METTLNREIPTIWALSPILHGFLSTDKICLTCALVTLSLSKAPAAHIYVLAFSTIFVLKSNEISLGTFLCADFLLFVCSFFVEVIALYKLFFIALKQNFYVVLSFFHHAVYCRTANNQLFCFGANLKASCLPDKILNISNLLILEKNNAVSPRLDRYNSQSSHS